MSRMLRFVYYRLFIRLIVLVVLGLNVRHKDKLPQKGPAILVANHNSHLDTMVLMTLLPGHLLPVTKPVAAMDYFLRNRLLAWFALNIVGILPIKRKRDKREEDPLAPCYEALANGNILIFFPEGSRGQPEQLTDFKGGIAKLAEKCPDVPIVPVLLHGLGKSLPKGESLLVPFFCDVFVGDALQWNGDRKAFMHSLEDRMQSLAGEGQFSVWE